MLSDLPMALSDAFGANSKHQANEATTQEIDEHVWSTRTLLHYSSMLKSRVQRLTNTTWLPKHMSSMKPLRSDLGDDMRNMMHVHTLLYESNDPYFDIKDAHHVA